ncbi:type II secretion system protein F [Microbacterium sorbitolivorans]|uniref:Type II secretion system F family protein n=1 Tax=Microbacterium sorbitolivorans TaxID=1867410 RepID=A0A367XXS8_9MICO|nr:type II secretion system F family protein [Microbacterium sorbitolivorans]RCK58413.1 type II secretion system F family protein [Microbacterium sorbitolivorans]GGF36337.1 type II secretion system protein F [Microbacterium sorbitolivorans]
MTPRAYKYEARDMTGQKIAGEVQAESADAVATKLQAQGAIATSIAESGRGLQREIHLRPGGARPSRRDVVLFIRQFATLVAAGVPLVRSLDILADQSERPSMRAAVEAVREEVVAGSSLSDAFSAQPDTFPAILRHMARAGETAGFLDQALARAATVLENEQKLRQKVRSAMTYPAVVLGIMVVIVTVMLAFVVPIFENMFADLGGKLPFATQVLVTLSDNLWWILPAVAALAIAAVLLFRRARQIPEQRRALDALALCLPVFGALNQKVAMSRFSRNLGMLLGAGVPVLEALDVVAATVGNQRVSDVVALVRDSVRDGNSLSGPMTEHAKIFPPMVAHMLRVGEDSGQVEQMLEKVAEFYDDEVETTTDALTSLLEPLLIVVLGVVTGGMVIALYLPMFSIYGQIS